MPKTEFIIPFREGESFFASEWFPEGLSKGVILLIHGLSDHAGRYRQVVIKDQCSTATFTIPTPFSV